MTINKELIEKYHEGTCSSEEKKAVENWLFSDESAEILSLSDKDKMAYQTEMWSEIASVLPQKGSKTKVRQWNDLVFPFWKQVAAAILFVGTLGWGLLYLKNSLPVRSHIVMMNNSSDTMNKDLHAQEYTISVGPKSNVEINNETGMLDFCGAVMINPKKDIEFTLQGKCINPSKNSEKVILKKGLNYIALNYDNASNTSEMIIFEEGAMMGLPPLMMKQILHQFKI